MLDAWAFDSSYGNGLIDQIRNENYDKVANGICAIRTHGVQRLCDFADAIEEVLKKYSINCNSEDALACVEKFSETDMSTLEAELEEAE